MGRQRLLQVVRTRDLWWEGHMLWQGQKRAVPEGGSHGELGNRATGRNSLRTQLVPQRSQRAHTHEVAQGLGGDGARLREEGFPPRRHKTYDPPRWGLGPPRRRRDTRCCSPVRCRPVGVLCSLLVGILAGAQYGACTVEPVLQLAQGRTRRRAFFWQSSSDQRARVDRYPGGIAHLLM